jgi:hypothetical protein
VFLSIIALKLLQFGQHVFQQFDNLCVQVVLHLSKQWAYGPREKVAGSLQYSSKHSSRFHRECITTPRGQKCVEHAIYMESEEAIVDMAIRAGFTIESIYTYDMPYVHQRLYVFRC